MNKEVVGTSLAFLAAIISGFSIFTNKIFIINLEPSVFTALRAIIIGLAFLILSFIFHSWNKTENKKLRWGYLLFIGIIGGGLAFLLFFNGLKLTTAGRAAFLHKTLPLYVLVLAFVFLKERITKKQIIAFLLMLIGLIVMIWESVQPSEFWLNPRMGDFLVIGATILWAVENIAARKVMLKGEHNFVVSFARMFFGAIFLFGIVLLTNKINLILQITAIQWFYILISTTILFAYVFSFYFSIKHINVSKATTILLLAPVITLILGVMFLNEPLSAMQITGSALILLGAYFVAGITSRFSNT